MKKTMTVFFAVIAIWAVGNVDSAAPTNAPAPAVDCSTLIVNMVDCLSFVSNGSTVKKPGGNCCSGLKKVLKTDAECLCEAFKNSGQLGVTLNVSKAVTLPAACHLSAPSLSNCGLSLAGGPAAAPATSPGGVSPSPTAGGSPSTEGAVPPSAPTPSPGSSGCSAVVVSVGYLLAAAAVAASIPSF